MRSFCRHHNYRTITNIREPKYSTNEVLINVKHITDRVDDYLIKFSDCRSIPDWFYLSKKVIEEGRTQKNGAGTVYVVPLSKREGFTPVKNCEHNLK